MIGSVCVYAASSEAVGEGHRRVAAELGRAIAREGWDLVYGGGSVGLMGVLAREALAAGAHVTGVIPHRLARREIVFTEVTELIQTQTMRERKQIMDERSDAFVVLPGGIGTLEELLEILTLKQLGYHDRAVVILDSCGYWDPLLTQFDRMITDRLAYPGLVTLWQVTSDVEGTVEALRHYGLPPPHPLGAVELEVVEEAP